MSRVKYIATSASACILGVVFLSAVAFGQSQIRITRPIDGSTVRETVNILVPVSCVPDNGFIVYNVDGHFKAGQAITTPNGAYYIYSWNTKALDPNTDLPIADRKPRDGRHIISVQACDPTGNRVGSPKEITVYVKNHLSQSDLPPGGIKLRYSLRPRTQSKYKFDCHINLTSAKGADANLVKSVGEAVEGKTGTIRKTIEYLFDSSRAFVSQSLVGKLGRYKSGRLKLDGGNTSKEAYEDQDTRGVTTCISTNGPGSPMRVEFPVLPAHTVRIGDVWKQQAHILWDPEDGKDISMTATNTFEGLEWERGYPCVKIRTTFSGKAKIPFSSSFSTPVKLSGETITYFAYRVGKVIISETRASATMNVGEDVVEAAVQGALPAGSALFPNHPLQYRSAGMFGAGMGRSTLSGGHMGAPASGRRPDPLLSRGMRPDPLAGRMSNPGMVGGPPGMENPMGGPMGMGGYAGASAYSAESVDVGVDIRETLELVQ